VKRLCTRGPNYPACNPVRSSKHNREEHDYPRVVSFKSQRIRVLISQYIYRFSFNFCFGSSLNARFGMNKIENIYSCRGTVGDIVPIFVTDQA
jgi:hypothetical protein